MPAYPLPMPPGCSNVLDHPGEERYRRVKAGNAAFQSKLGCRPGGKECMEAIGFR